MEAIISTFLSNQFLQWAVFIVGGIALLPVASTVLDYVISALSDVMTVINREIVDKIPIPPLKDWLQNQQIDMLNKSIDTIKKAIAKIQEK